MQFVGQYIFTSVIVYMVRPQSTMQQRVFINPFIRVNASMDIFYTFFFIEVQDTCTSVSFIVCEIQILNST